MERILRQQTLPERGPAVAVELLDGMHDMPMHAHEYVELVLVESGSAVHTTRHGSRTVDAGFSALVRPGEVHSWTCTRRLKLWNVYIGPEVLRGELGWFRSTAVGNALIGLPHPGSEVERLLSFEATEGFHYARSAIRRAGVQPGDQVLVNGATGGIGSAAVQQLAALGAIVTAVCAGEHADLVRGLGAEQVVDYTSEDFTRLPYRFDVVIDAVGKSTFGRCRRILRPGGVYVSSELGPGWQNLPLSLLGMLRRGRQRVVFPVPEEGQSVVEEIRDHLAAGTFRPVIDRTYPLEEIVAAYRYVETGQKIGNVVVTVGAAGPDLG